MFVPTTRLACCEDHPSGQMPGPARQHPCVLSMACEEPIPLDGQDVVPALGCVRLQQSITYGRGSDRSKLCEAVANLRGRIRLTSARKLYTRCGARQLLAPFGPFSRGGPNIQVPRLWPLPSKGNPTDGATLLNEKANGGSVCLL